MEEEKEATAANRLFSWVGLGWREVSRLLAAGRRRKGKNFFLCFRQGELLVLIASAVLPSDMVGRSVGRGFSERKGKRKRKAVSIWGEEHTKLERTGT